MSGPIQPVTELNEIAQLLGRCNLPVSDISPANLPKFFGIHSGTRLIALIGIELLGSTGLLRSLAVEPDCRRQNLGHELVAYAEHFASQQGVQTLYLLTTTAREFFLKLGYTSQARADAPPVIQSTPQFSELCPNTAALLCKCLAG